MSSDDETEDELRTRIDAIARRVLESGQSDDEYLRGIEQLAHELVEAACSLYGGARVFSLEGDKNDLDRAITMMAQSLRMTHAAGDGCVDDSELPPP